MTSDGKISIWLVYPNNLDKKVLFFQRFLLIIRILSAEFTSKVDTKIIRNLEKLSSMTYHDDYIYT